MSLQLLVDSYFLLKAVVLWDTWNPNELVTIELEGKMK